jgi:AcrR family transcriptional regulator
MNERSFMDQIMAPEALLTRGESTRAGIMQAAHELFLEKGYSGTSMRQIARRAGVAVGGIYNHFDSKEDIFAAIFVERHPFFQIVPILDAARGNSLEDLLRDVARRMVEVLKERPDFLNLLFIEMIEFRARHMPAFVEKALPRLQSLVKRFESAQARERLRPLPVYMILRAFLGMFVSYAISEQLIGSLPAEAKTDSLNYFIDIFLHGILVS